ncbi:Surfactin synthase thioesterase subunit [Pseudomonas sp. 8Z]|uniref:thioesterase II family protein n=1 Tax=Pseudomonas sp. 8Z TaxID=2653166 RepID=UPI0012F0B7AF|nr:alpha/beta fold hydrolase [Pseudomonas sp. 8Z]VXC59654.1 Surfactin synthase thioesterase subunit [Pseudomonas sp. 8Z]
MQRPSSPWFSVLASGAQLPVLRLYCFPYAGAGHTVFQHWRAGLPSDIELALVKLPGRGARFGEPRATSLAELAEALAVEVAQAYADGIPFAFFGHSMGALLAFETARQLARQGLSPAQLLVSARTAPLAHGWRERLANLPQAQFLEIIRGMNGLPQELLDNPEWIELFLPIIRDDFALCEDYCYHPAPLLPCPIQVLAGETDASVPLSLLDGWAQESQAECRTWLFPGGHFYLFEQEAELLALIQRLLLSDPLRQVAN